MEQDENVPFSKNAITKGPSVSSLSSDSIDEDQKSVVSNLTTKSDANTRDLNRQEHQLNGKFDKVSQAERDAAHNLVQLHLQCNFPTKNTTSSSSNVSPDSSSRKTVPSSSSSDKTYRVYSMPAYHHQQFLPKSNTIVSTYQMTNYSPGNVPHRLYDGSPQSYQGPYPNRYTVSL